VTERTITDYCLSKQYAVLEYPFGPEPATFKVGGKIFTVLHAKNDVIKLTLKCDPMLADLLRQQYQSVMPGYKSTHWNRVICDGSIPDDEIFHQIDNSHGLIMKSLTKKVRERLKRESHPLYLFPDPNYQPLEIRESDEYFPNGIFIFNITRLLEHIAAHRGEYKLVAVKVADHMTLPSRIPLEKCADADFHDPVMLAEISPGRYNLIDGNHRMTKAHHDGVETLQAYMLSPKQHSLFITEQKAYDAYIAYWNGKLQNLSEHKEKSPFFDLN